MKKLNENIMQAQACATHDMVTTTFKKKKILKNTNIMQLFMLLDKQLASLEAK
jgi:hypothetical protein